MRHLLRPHEGGRLRTVRPPRRVRNMRPPRADDALPHLPSGHQAARAHLRRVSGVAGVASSPVPRGSGLGGSVGRELVTNEQTSRKRDADRARDRFITLNKPLYKPLSDQDRARERAPDGAPGPRETAAHSARRFPLRAALLLIRAESCHYKRARHNDATPIHAIHKRERQRRDMVRH